MYYCFSLFLSFPFRLFFFFNLTSQFGDTPHRRPFKYTPRNVLLAYVLANVCFAWIDAYGFNLCKWYCAAYRILAHSLFLSRSVTFYTGGPPLGVQSVLSHAGAWFPCSLSQRRTPESLHLSATSGRATLNTLLHRPF